MLEFTIGGSVERGRVNVTERAWRSLREAVSRWPNCPIVVTVKRKHATRSLQQNAYLWGVVYALLSDHTGYTPEEIHDYCKMRFLPKRVCIANGNGEVVDDLVIGGSTAKLNKLEFGEYVDAIRSWARETLDVEIPLPQSELAA